MGFCIFILGIGRAQADTYTLSLTGNTNAATTSSFVGGGTQYDNWSLALSFPANYTPITVSVGDMIDATITLDQSVTIPQSVSSTAFILFLGSTDPADAATGVSGSTQFFDNGIPGPSRGAGTGTSGTLANSVVFSPPDNTSFTFDTVYSDFTITLPTSTSPGYSVTLDNASIYYQLASPAVTPVAEPSIALLLGTGLAGVVGAVRRELMA
jgi:hypothetical protein